jgi:hypothetical protein
MAFLFITGFSFEAEKLRFLKVVFREKIELVLLNDISCF